MNLSRRNRRTSLVLGTAWVLTGAAHACDVQSGLDLHYRASQEGQGQFWVRVSCAPGEVAYRLRLVGNSAAGTAPTDLRVNLQARRGAEVLTTTLLNVWPTLGSLARDGEVLSGSRTLRFDVQVPAGQWVPAGQYDLPLAVILEPQGTP